MTTDMVISIAVEYRSKVPGLNMRDSHHSFDTIPYLHGLRPKIRYEELKHMGIRMEIKRFWVSLPVVRG
ncbi:hypothetical protein [Tropicibacter oceani]|uniref:Uncharacterized protein n=1 Tax=Tropicibacter oceani TaxID=3058420 RepID=A0ABY8QHF2_9RHOB|nr:hypothetical protein [Tropicibacter oceani]WGW03587.1 hypothetical protein QF118_16935 [Tropicibacter oceani]